MISLSEQSSQWSDRRLIEAVASVVAVPRRGPADSFVLHAPLEVLARAVLLGHVPPDGREAARRRLAEVAERYEAADDPVDPPSPIAPPSVEWAARRLVETIGAGDLVEVDRCAAWLDLHATVRELRMHLGDATVRSLAAAGHAPILFALLPRVDRMRTSLLRGPVRELARDPERALSWFDAPDLDAPGPGAPALDGTSLFDALRSVPSLGVPGSTFIEPMMRQAEDSGWAEKLLGPMLSAQIDLAKATREMAMIASLSMLQEPTTHAKFGWTHCRTMPQAVMGMAGVELTARTAVAVAATHVVGFRAALGTVELDIRQEPEVDLSPDPEGWLAANASGHHDAHLVKFTLACLDAARADPANRRWHLAAARRLAVCWSIDPSGY